MKLIVLGMMKFKMTIILSFLVVIGLQAQAKYEREHRIKKSQFPDSALNIIESTTKDIKRLKFYQEIDSVKISYEAKFKKSSLWYSMEFTTDGVLEDIEITIKTTDIPNESFDKITTYVNQEFTSFKITKIQQQYLVNGNDSKIIKEAFQNLMIPSLNYEIMIEGKKENTYEDFEILFDAEGTFISIRKSLPPNYDHVLY